MRGDPPADVHADSSDLAILHPDAGATGEAARRKAELHERVDNHLLEPSHVGDHVPLPFPKVQDGVAYQLPGAVVGDIAAAVRLEKLDAGPLEHLRPRQQVLSAPVAAQGDHVRMLEQQELIRDRALLALLDQLGLQAQRLAVADASQLAQLAPTH